MDQNNSCYCNHNEDYLSCGLRGPMGPKETRGRQVPRVSKGIPVVLALRGTEGNRGRLALRVFQALPVQGDQEAVTDREVTQAPRVFRGFVGKWDRKATPAVKVRKET